MAIIGHFKKQLVSLSNDGKTFVDSQGTVSTYTTPAELADFVPVRLPGIGDFGVLSVPTKYATAQLQDMNRRICLVIPSQVEQASPLRNRLQASVEFTEGPADCRYCVTVLCHGRVINVPGTWVYILDLVERPPVLEACPHAFVLGVAPDAEDYMTDWVGPENKDEAQSPLDMWNLVGQKGLVRGTGLNRDLRMITSEPMQWLHPGNTIDDAILALVELQSGFSANIGQLQYRWRLLDQKVSGMFCTYKDNGELLPVEIEEPAASTVPAAAPVSRPTPPPAPEIKYSDGRPYRLIRGTFVIPFASDERWQSGGPPAVGPWNIKATIQSFINDEKGVPYSARLSSGLIVPIKDLRVPELEKFCDVLYSPDYTAVAKIKDMKELQAEGLQIDREAHLGPFCWTGDTKVLKSGKEALKLSYCSAFVRRYFYAMKDSLDIYGVWHPKMSVLCPGDKVTLCPMPADTAGVRVHYGKTFTVRSIEETTRGYRVALDGCPSQLSTSLRPVELVCRDITPPDKSVAFCSPSRDNDFEVSTVDCLLGEAFLRLQDKKTGARCTVTMQKDTLVGLLKSALFVLDPPPPKPKETPVAVETSDKAPKPVPEEKLSPKARKRPKKAVPEVTCEPEAG